MKSSKDTSKKATRVKDKSSPETVIYKTDDSVVKDIKRLDGLLKATHRVVSDLQKSSTGWTDKGEELEFRQDTQSKRIDLCVTQHKKLDTDLTNRITKLAVLQQSQGIRQEQLLEEVRLYQEQTTQAFNQYQTALAEYNSQSKDRIDSLDNIYGGLIKTLQRKDDILKAFVDKRTEESAFVVGKIFDYLRKPWYKRIFTKI